MSSGPRPPLPGEVSRRALLAAGPALAASLVACADLLSRTEAASGWLVDPSLDRYRAVLDALAATVLPLELDGFPLRAPRRVSDRLLQLFPLERERRFLGLQRTLLLFDATELFPRVEGPIEATEREQLGAFGDPGVAAIEAELEAKRRREGEAWSAYRRRFAGEPQRFVEATLTAQRAYFELWGASPYVLRREFRNATRALILTTVYSLEEVWPAIGYAGPLVEAGGRREPRT